MVFEDPFRATQEESGHDHRDDRAAKRAQSDPNIELRAHDEEKSQRNGDPTLLANAECQQRENHGVENCIHHQPDRGSRLLKCLEDCPEHAKTGVGKHSDPSVGDALVGIIVDGERFPLWLVFHAGC